MAYVKQLNNKAAVSTDTNDLEVPNGVHISAVFFMDEIRFYGADDEEGLLVIGRTINPMIETIAEAKTEIDGIGCRFLNGTLVTN